jgi:voltage-gated potassium channel
MYGATEIGKPNRGGDHVLNSFEQSPDRRKQFVLRRQRDSTKRRLKEIESEKPVFSTVFELPSVPSRSRARNLRSTSTDDVLEGDDDATPLHQQHAPTSTKHHSFLYSMLNPHSRKLQAVLFKRFITLVITTDLVFFVLSTDDSFTYFSDRFYHAAEGIASCIFLLEYLARFATIMEKHKYANMGPIQGRLEYARSFPAMVDLLAALPFFLEIPTGWNLPTLTYLRFIRLFRILKTEGYIRALDAVYRVVYYNRQILYVATLVCAFLVLVTSVLLYYARPTGDKASPLFDSLGDTMYMSTLMLTGGGGPDTDDLPWYTKGVVLLTSVFSVAMFAIPASMLTWGFEAEAERMAKQARKLALKQRAKGMSSFSSSSSEDDSDGNTTDEEYFALIAGADDEGDKEETSWMKEQRQKFQTADADQDGTLTLKEFVRLQQEHEGPLEPTAFLQRLQALELQAADNASKLSRILTLLEERR